MMGKHPRLGGGLGEKRCENWKTTDKTKAFFKTVFFGAIITYYSVVVSTG